VTFDRKGESGTDSRVPSAEPRKCDTLAHDGSAAGAA
jgi:hypothetical protein